MLRSLLLAASCLALSSGSAGPERAPVLVELFTSEGCSSCPPADRQLERLDSQVIVLSEHVDYWNQLGWKDQFSSPAFTQRQEAYVRQFGLDGPYTPQMVVDGVAQFTGGDGHRAEAEIAKAAAAPKVNIFLARNAAGVQVQIEKAPHEGDIWLALADKSDTSRVAAGENKGRTLTHVAVVRSLRKIGYVKRNATFSHQVDLPSSSAPQRIVVFVQETGPAHIFGVAMLPGTDN